jgi:uncharacterized protein YndB with AHSA1/START domain
VTNPRVEHRFEVELVVPGTPEQVWDAIATAEGIAAWMAPTELDARVGGAVTFHMGPGPDDVSRGQITALDPSRRVAYDEDWATLTGHAGADVTPLQTEFLVEAASGGTCVVRVVTSAFGAGAEWEHEFFDEMTSGWGAMLDNLRLYMTHFPGQTAMPMWAGASITGDPGDAIAAVCDGLGVAAVGDPVDALGIGGRLERAIPRHVLVVVDRPVDGLMSFFAYGGDDEGGISLQGHLFGEQAAAWVEREQPRWQEWLDTITRTGAEERAHA